MDTAPSKDRARILRHVCIAYVALVLMNYIDWLYTHSAISMDGTETNPIMNWVLIHYGMVGIAWFKVVTVALLGILLGFIHLEGRRHLRWFFYFTVCVYTWLTLYHVVWYYQVGALVYW